MTNAWFVGASYSVPQTENEVRSTVEPIRTDHENAEAQDAPDFNEFQSDNSGQLVGLSPRVKGADTTDSEKYVPFWAGLASTPHNILIDQQVASSGTAAARESAGIQGHGTMQYEESLDPVIREGAAFGNDYFSTAPNVIQEGAGAYMAPTSTDNWNQAVASAEAERRSRQAFQATVMQSFLNG